MYEGSLPWQETARVFAAAVESGRCDLPLPGSGATAERLAALADLAEATRKLTGSWPGEGDEQDEQGKDDGGKEG